MPLVATQLYVQSLLVGMTPPGDTGIRQPISALITPKDPDIDPDGIPRCYVWPARAPEERIAMPRNTGENTPAGWKKLTHDLQVFLVWMDSPDDLNADVNFPAFIDYVMNVLRTSPNPFMYTDPETGDVSWQINIGEKMTYDFPPPRTLEPQAMRRYDARVSITALELFIA